MPRRTSRRILADAHAPTAHAGWSRPQRWRYVAGGLAIAGCIALFFLSRGGDRVASAAAPAAGAGVHGAAEAALAAPVAVTARSGAMAAALPVAWAGTDARGEAPDLFEVDAITGEAPGVVVLPPKAGRAERSTATSASRPASRVRAVAKPTAGERQHAASPNRRAPAAPRRPAKIDPNGTIDPYR